MQYFERSYGMQMVSIVNEIGISTMTHKPRSAISLGCAPPPSWVHQPINPPSSWTAGYGPFTSRLISISVNAGIRHLAVAQPLQTNTALSIISIFFIFSAFESNVCAQDRGETAGFTEYPAAPCSVQFLYGIFMNVIFPSFSVA